MVSQQLVTAKTPTNQLVEKIRSKYAEPRAWADVSGVLADFEAAHSNLPGRFKAYPDHLPNPPAWLLLVDHPRPADLLRDEADSNLDTVGDFDEGDAAIHPVVLTVESQCPLDVSRAGPLAGKR